MRGDRKVKKKTAEGYLKLKNIFTLGRLSGIESRASRSHAEYIFVLIGFIFENLWKIHQVL